MSTQLTIMRHGIAADVGSHGVKRDEDRMLSEKGRSLTQLAATGLNRIDIRPTRIVCSPYLRAYETAAIVAAVYESSLTPEPLECLVPNGDIDTTLAWLAEQSDDHLMLVGHLPHVETLSSALFAREAMINIMFHPATVCSIQFYNTIEPARGVLHGFWQADQLATIGEK